MDGGFDGRRARFWRRTLTIIILAVAALQLAVGAWDLFMARAIGPDVAAWRAERCEGVCGFPFPPYAEAGRLLVFSSLAWSPLLLWAFRSGDWLRVAAVIQLVAPAALIMVLMFPALSNSLAGRGEHALFYPLHAALGAAAAVLGYGLLAAHDLLPRRPEPAVTE